MKAQRQLNLNTNELRMYYISLCVRELRMREDDVYYMLASQNWTIMGYGDTLTTDGYVIYFK